MKNRTVSLWKPRLGLIVGGFAVLVGQARIPFTAGARSAFLIIWVLLFYGILGVLNSRAITREERDSKSPSTRVVVRLESPLYKANGVIHPRHYATGGTKDATGNQPAEREAQ